MTRQELQQIAGAKLSDAELIEKALDDAFCLRKNGNEVVELIQDCLNALGLKRY